MINKDWHSADIIATLKKKGTTLAAESRKAGLASSTLSNTLVRLWTKGESIIAKILDIPPKHIWLSRYLNKTRRIKTPKESNL